MSEDNRRRVQWFIYNHPPFCFAGEIADGLDLPITEVDSISKDLKQAGLIELKHPKSSADLDDWRKVAVFGASAHRMVERLSGSASLNLPMLDSP